MFERGYAGGPWLAVLEQSQALFVIRWKKGHVFFDVDWEKLFPTGFRPQPRRWVIERFFSLLVRWRRLSRDHEGLPESSEAFIKLAASARMLTHLAPAFPS
ncbi:hypothetical protein ccbrp13_32470 [Ktedonobacteria bacterium brp13]|nr:hypothetical protein ccbrp13_32470 [Ktedonobacteria bacterium brp13]